MKNKIFLTTRTGTCVTGYNMGMTDLGVWVYANDSRTFVPHDNIDTLEERTE